MHMKICHIIGAGEMQGVRINVKDGDYLIAADAGYAEAQRQGLKPDLVVGDFDSLGSEPAGENVIKHPVMKDDTDTMLAVKLGFEKGFTQFFLYGMLGGRLDHTIANLQTIEYIAARGGRGYIIGGDSVVCAIKDGEICFDGAAKGIVSVFCLGAPAKGVSIEGLLYPLENYTLTPDMPLGVSNEFTGKPARICVKDGVIIALFPNTACVKNL